MFGGLNTDGMVVTPVLLLSTVPAMPRIQTPPPCWSGRGPPGALTKALVLVRNEVLTVLMTETSELTEPPCPNGRRVDSPGSGTPATAKVSRHSAQAADEPSDPERQRRPAQRRALECTPAVTGSRPRRPTRKRTCPQHDTPKRRTSRPRDAAAPSSRPTLVPGRRLAIRFAQFRHRPATFRGRLVAFLHHPKDGRRTTPVVRSRASRACREKRRAPGKVCPRLPIVS